MAKSTDVDDVPEAGNDNAPDDGDAQDIEASGEDASDEADDDGLPVRSEATDELWEEVGIQPVRIALPRDVVGYTLRAYRPAGELTPTETGAEAPDEDDPFAARERARAAEDAEFESALAAEATADSEQDQDEPAEEPTAEDFEQADEEPDEADDSVEEEEVPVFLSHRGKLLLFATPEALVSFVGSDAPHDLTQLDTWPTVAKRVRAEDIVPTEDDTYELDLVVENLRAGHDAWDLPLLIGAGELARDIGYALRLEPVVTALASGSPLDDLDEACRAAASGGIGGIFARRRLRKVGAQQASLGWRTIIGKIADAVDWRD